MEKVVGLVLIVGITVLKECETVTQKVKLVGFLGNLLVGGIPLLRWMHWYQKKKFDRVRYQLDNFSWCTLKEEYLRTRDSHLLSELQKHPHWPYNKHEIWEEAPEAVEVLMRLLVWNLFIIFLDITFSVPTPQDLGA